MPTPLFPPPTPLLSALPAPPRCPVPSPRSSAELSGWSPPSTSAFSPLLSLSSSAPAELPSFHLEVSAAASSARRLSVASPRQRRRTGVSLLTSSLTAAASASTAQPDCQQQSTATSPLSRSLSSSASAIGSQVDELGESATPLLAAALAKQSHRQQQQKQLDGATVRSEQTAASSAKADSNTEAISTVVQLKPAPPLPHSQSFSVGEARNAAVLTLPSTSAVHASSAQTSSSTPQQPLPASSAVRAAVKAASVSDLRSMARLTSFSSLLSHCKPDTWVVLDLDDTVYCGYHAPCHMMTERGLQRYQALITSHPHYKQLPFASKSSITRQLQAAVSRKRGVERDTIRTIKQLQAAGVPVFALTARFSSMIATTKLELASLSLDLSLTSPFKTFVRDGETSAVISDGIIFSDGQEKGPILNRFLSNVLFHKHLRLTPPLAPPPSSPPLPSSRPISIHPPSVATSASAASSGATSPLSSSLPSPARIVFRTSKRLRVKKMRGKLDEDDETAPPHTTSASTAHTVAISGGSRSRLNADISAASLDGARKDGVEGDSLLPLPRRLVFVDDRLQNCVSVMNGLRCTQQLSIAVLTYHYTPSPATERAQHSSADDDDSDSEAEGMRDEDDEEEDEAARLEALAEYQIHHFIRTQQVLNDAAAARHRRRSSRVSSPTSSPHSPPSRRALSRPSPDSSPETGALPAHVHDLLYDDDRDELAVPHKGKTAGRATDAPTINVL